MVSDKGGERNGGARWWVGLVLVMLAAAAIRLSPAREVFVGGEIRWLGDGDAVYHVLRAQRTAADWPHPPWRDPGLDHPDGALIPWPPLFDQLIATASVITPGGADPGHVARVAAVTPVVVAIATVLLLALLARSLTGGGSLAAAFVASMLPASVHYGYVGLPDHHVAELFLLCAALLAYHRAWAAERLRKGSAILLGVALALSFWNWPGSGLYLVLLALHAAANHLVEPEGPSAACRVESALAWGSGTATLLLALTVLLFAPEGAIASMALISIGGLAVLLCAVVTTGAILLLAAHRVRSRRSRVSHRVGEIVLAGSLSGLALLAVPGIARAIEHGLTALGAANGWYASITEFRSALLSNQVPIADEVKGLFAFYGLALLALPLGVWAVVRRWSDGAGRRQSLLLLAVCCLVFVVLALYRMRFMLYLSAPLGICAALGIHDLASRAGRFRSALVAAGAAAVVLPAYVWVPRPEPAVDSIVAAAAGWVGTATPANRGATGVLAPWYLGHAMRAAGRPVVGSPFGTDVSRASLDDEAAFFCSSSAKDARDIVRRRRIGFVIVHSPLVAVDSIQSFRPAGIPEPLVTSVPSWSRGATRVPEKSFSATTTARLFYGDGMAPRDRDEPAIGWLRLLREELPPEASGGPPPRQLKSFGVVEGARLVVEDTHEGMRVTASIRLRTNQGRTVTWRTFTLAGATGAELRVPYSTGINGLVVASPCVVTDGVGSAEIDVSEEAVVAGNTLVVRLEPAAPLRDRLGRGASGGKILTQLAIPEAIGGGEQPAAREP